MSVIPEFDKAEGRKRPGWVRQAPAELWLQRPSGDWTWRALQRRRNQDGCREGGREGEKWERSRKSLSFSGSAGLQIWDPWCPGFQSGGEADREERRSEQGEKRFYNVWRRGDEGTAQQERVSTQSHPQLFTLPSAWAGPGQSAERLSPPSGSESHYTDMISLPQPVAPSAADSAAAAVGNFMLIFIRWKSALSALCQGPDGVKIHIIIGSQLISCFLYALFSIWSFFSSFFKINLMVLSRLCFTQHCSFVLCTFILFVYLFDYDYYFVGKVPKNNDNNNNDNHHHHHHIIDVYFPFFSLQRNLNLLSHEVSVTCTFHTSHRQLLVVTCPPPHLDNNTQQYYLLSTPALSPNLPTPLLMDAFFSSYR